MGIQNNNRCNSELLVPKVVPFLQGILDLSFNWIMPDHMLQRMFKTSCQKRLTWPAYSYFPDISHIKYNFDSVDRHLTRDPCPTTYTDEFWKRIQRLWNSLFQADIPFKICLISCYVTKQFLLQHVAATPNTGEFNR